ncbi:MAG: arginase family protein [Myxococcales bacterium]|nr:arginase family protein [Myxococcales bacterium]
MSDKRAIHKTLETILAPAGGGVHLVSTGLEETQELQRAIYGAASVQGIGTCWHRSIEKISESSIVLLGVPSDTGAGFVRGASQGPAGIRRALLDIPEHVAHGANVVDAGDVRVVPHLLSEEMVSEAQLRSTRAALYGDAASDLPVTPLDQCYLALELLRKLRPDIVPIVIGGDHSVGWPAFAVAHASTVARGLKVGLLHFDAHTDLLAERLGVRYCFATWAYHANELLGRDGRLVQVGIRASGKSRGHWESTLGVRQYWPEEYLVRPITDIVNEISERFEERGVDCLYISNDIDGTDREFATATGTPEDRGLRPEQVSELTLRLAERFPLVGADLVEVAPPLGIPEDAKTTLETACLYVADMITAAGSAR